MRDRRTFWHDGQRYELRAWHDRPTRAERAAGISTVGDQAQARFILGAALRRGGPFAGAFTAFVDATPSPGRAAPRLDRLLEELRLGQRVLVTAHTRLPVDGLASVHEHVVDLADLVDLEPIEDTWVEFVFEYPDRTKVSGLEYVLIDPTQALAPGTLTRSGTITRRGVAPGEYTVVLKEIEHAVWARARAAADDELKVIARTSGYPDGTPATVKLYRERIESAGDEIAVVQAEVHGDVIEATLRWDGTADPHAEHDADEGGRIGLIAEVSLDGGKVWAKTQRALQLEPRALRSVAWSSARAGVGEMVEIVVEAPGHAPHEQVALELWRLDWIEGDTKVGDIFSLPIQDGKAIARCSYGNDPEADVRISDCGEYYVVARIDGAIARTVTSGLLWCAWVDTGVSAEEERAA